MAELRVGGFYGQPQARPEGLYVTGLSARRMEVLVIYAGLTDADVRKWQEGPIMVGLAEAGGLAVLLVRDPISEADAPYDIRAGGAGERGLPGERYGAITWILLEAETGRIRALKLGSVTPTFMQTLRPILAQQLLYPLDVTDYGRRVDAYQSQYAIADLWQRALVREQLGLTEPIAPSAARSLTAADVQARYPQLDARVCEVLAETLASGVAHIETRASEDWYVDPEFGDDTPVAQLGYDETLGMVDRRRWPKNGQA